MNNLNDATLKLMDYFWNCVKVDYDDDGSNSYIDVVNSEFNDIMDDLFGYGLYDVEAVVLDLNIGEWIIPDLSDLFKHGYTESMIRQIDSDMEGHSLIRLNDIFINFMQERHKDSL